MPTIACATSWANIGNIPNPSQATDCRGEMKIWGSLSDAALASQHSPIACLPLPRPRDEGQPQLTRTGGTLYPASTKSGVNSVTALSSHASRFEGGTIVFFVLLIKCKWSVHT